MDFLKRLIGPFQPIQKKNRHLTVEDLIQRYDVFYVCYDEPNRFENWSQIKGYVPKARKVEGVIGFDNALKTCARLSRTSHFFVVDGDNQWIGNKLQSPLPFRSFDEHWVLSWSSLNPANGLCYGNGGLKLWPQQVALEIKSHENATDKSDQTDYCFLADYYLVDDHVTQTLVHRTPLQAFRAGFREGVKMSLSWGLQVELSDENFDSELGWQNRERLKVWCEVGSDVANGDWGILGARFGLKKNVIDQFDCRQMNSHKWIESAFITEVLKPLGVTQFPLTNTQKIEQRQMIDSLGDAINQKIPIDLKYLEPQASKKFKENFKNPERSGLLSLRGKKNQ